MEVASTCTHTHTHTHSHTLHLSIESFRGGFHRKYVEANGNNDHHLDYLSDILLWHIR